ncbi:MAG: hypothetical protein ACREOG_12015, partial [Gemmatimonadaceae bacterium]
MRLPMFRQSFVRCLCVLGCAACAPATSSRELAAVLSAPAPALARVYYWRARPGKLDEYNRYVREIAEPIDREAQRQGAFISVTT